MSPHQQLRSGGRLNLVLVHEKLEQPRTQGDRDPHDDALPVENFTPSKENEGGQGNPCCQHAVHGQKEVR